MTRGARLGKDAATLLHMQRAASSEFGLRPAFSKGVALRAHPPASLYAAKNLGIGHGHGHGHEKKLPRGDRCAKKHAFSNYQTEPNCRGPGKSVRDSVDQENIRVEC